MIRLDWNLRKTWYSYLNENETVERTLVGEKCRAKGAGGFARIASSIRDHHSQLKLAQTVRGPSERCDTELCGESLLSRCAVPVHERFYKGSTNAGSSKFEAEAQEAEAPGAFALRAGLRV